MKVQILRKKGAGMFDEIIFFFDGYATFVL
jgi:hypothetical protein